MKKLFALIAVMAFCTMTYADLRYVAYTPDTNGVVTITGVARWTYTPVAIMQEITGVTTNTATMTFTPSGGVAYRVAPLTAVIGGAEVPQTLNDGTTVAYPRAINGGDVWTITKSAGTAYSNLVYTVLYDVQRPQ